MMCSRRDDIMFLCNVLRTFKCSTVHNATGNISKSSTNIESWNAGKTQPNTSRQLKPPVEPRKNVDAFLH